MTSYFDKSKFEYLNVPIIMLNIFHEIIFKIMYITEMFETVVHYNTVMNNNIGIH